MQNLSSDSKPKIIPASDINGHAGSHSTGDARIDLREETYSSSQEDLKRLQNDSILKRIPVGAEATTVLVSIVCVWFMILDFVCLTFAHTYRDTYLSCSSCHTANFIN